jgi:hypothetical protein
MDDPAIPYGPFWCDQDAAANTRDHYDQMA